MIERHQAFITVLSLILSSMEVCSLHEWNHVSGDNTQ